MQEITPKKFKKYFLSLPFIQQAGFFLWPSFASDHLTNEEIKLLRKLKPSGCVLFKRNFKSFSQGKEFINSIQKIVQKNERKFKLPFIVSIDEEGGRVSRLPPPFTRGASALEFADKNDLEGLKNQLLFQTFVAKGLGVNCFLSPVADILTEPNNPAIGDRCFGRDVDSVIKFSSFVHKTLTSENIFSCAKHFPGHGNTNTDPHVAFSKSMVDLKTIQAREWKPFEALIRQKIPFIMAAHVLVPSLDEKNPATLSYQILTNYLRKKLKFKGIILSDDLRMNAMALHYKQKNRKQESSISESESVSQNEDDSYLKQASIDALKAGCDILLSCQSIVREEKIAQTIANFMKKDKIFQIELTEKAWNIYSTLVKIQKIHQ